jgi:protein gp37
MGKISAIEWTDHTFNPWWGCEKVSAGCQSCYAETFAKRVGQPVWGKAAPRRFFGAKHWMEPHKWDIEAKSEHVRRRVFCASMADVFEAREDLDRWREKLWDLIDTTRGLDWLLLTKRPENILQMIPAAWRKSARANVWFGTTAENQEQANKRIPELLQVPARVRFLSCEPLLGSIDLNAVPRLDNPYLKLNGERGVLRDEREVDDFAYWAKRDAIHWVIVGGESGPKARPCRVRWVRGLVGQCVIARVPVFVKQLGAHVIDANDAGFDGIEEREWPEDTQHDDWDEDPSRQYQGADTRIFLTDRKGGDPSEWPKDLRIQEFPKAVEV